MDRMRLFSLLAIVIIFVFYCIPKSKRSVYILPIYPFIAYFLAEYMLYLLKQKPKVWRVFSIFIASVGTLLLIILLLVKSGVGDHYRAILPDDLGYYMTAPGRVVEHRVDYLGHIHRLPHLRHLQE